MGREPEAEQLPEHHEGGPVKTFLEHLEDLRWMMIKCVAAIAVGTLICLIAGNYVVAILLRPLHQARIRIPGTNQVVTVFFGTNHFGPFQLDAAGEESFNLDPNRFAPAFSTNDIVNLPSLARKLAAAPDKKDGVSKFLDAQLSPPTLTSTSNYVANLPPWWKLWSEPPASLENPLRSALTDDLNRIIRGRPIYNAAAFTNVSLPGALKTAANQNLQGRQLARLNVQLLMAAYPSELSKEGSRFFALEMAPVTIPVGTNEVRVLALQVNTNADAAALAQGLRTSVNAFGPAKSFLVGFHVAIYAGIALASPFVFFFIGQFVLPALRITEKKYLWRGLFFAVPLFMCGVSFCYFVLMPVALAASQLYSDWFGFSSSYWDAGDYIGFVCKFMFGMGLGFELPVVILVLVKIGILDYATLRKARRYMIVINLILGAVLTTPEVITQVLMFLPLQGLYEISLLVAWYWERQAKKREAAEDQPGTD